VIAAAEVKRLTVTATIYRAFVKLARCQLQRRFFVLAKSSDCSRALMSENPEAFATN
jgi:hypothetical protein